jgi:hypothetical protein
MLFRLSAIRNDLSDQIPNLFVMTHDATLYKPRRIKQVPMRSWASLRVYANGEAALAALFNGGAQSMAD